MTQSITIKNDQIIQGKPPRKKKPKTKFQKQMARLDPVFNAWVRWNAADANLMCRCVSCGKLKPVKGAKCHAGHFVNKSLKTLFVRWDHRNVHPQCYHCNWSLKGNKYHYSEWLVKVYGPGVCEQLQIDSTRHFNPDVFNMEAKIKYYREAVKQLKIEKGIKYD